MRPYSFFVKRIYMDCWRNSMHYALKTAPVPEYLGRNITAKTLGFRAITENLRPSLLSKQGCSTGAGWFRRIEARGFSQHRKSSSDSTEITKAGDVQVPALTVEEKPSMVVSVFWDLDNKPPQDVPPFDAARRLREAASTFGHVVDFIAYANHHAFDFVPQWVREERRERKVLDWEEKAGIHIPDSPYVCGVCGHKFATNIKLKKHFKQLHERERTKRLNRMKQVSPKRRQKMKEANEERETKFREAVKGIFAPKRGYGLASDIKRAGVFVKTVPDKPQAADKALKLDMMKAIKSGVNCICLVSDDGDFRKDIELARSRKLRTVVIGNGSRLSSYGDIFLSWTDISSGRARRLASDAVSQWSEEQGLADVLQEGREENPSNSPLVRPGTSQRDEWGATELELEEEAIARMLRDEDEGQRRVSLFSEEDEWDLDEEEEWDEDEFEDGEEWGRDSLYRDYEAVQRGKGALRWWEIESEGVGSKKSS